MQVRAGGVVMNHDGYLGYFDSSSNNLVLVSDVGSLWTNSASLYVGNLGSGSQLVVSNGGVVASGNGHLGHSIVAIYNVATVTGALPLTGAPPSVAVAVTV